MSNNNNNNNCGTSEMIPAQLLQSFFENAIRRLEDHPSDEIVRQKLLTTTTTRDGQERQETEERQERQENEGIPISLQEQQGLLMGEQLNVLSQTVETFNFNFNINSNDGDYTIEEVQSCLRLLGSNDTSTVQFMVTKDVNDVNVNKNRNATKNMNIRAEGLIRLMTKLNDTARLAFVRSVLSSEVSWEAQYYPSNDNGTLNTTMRQREEARIEKERSFMLRLTKAGRERRHLIYRPSPYNNNNINDDQDDEHQMLLPNNNNNNNNNNQSDEDVATKQMDRGAVIQFCSLCSAAIRLQVVTDYFTSGTSLLPSFHVDDIHNNNNNNNNNTDNSQSWWKLQSPQQRVLHIQHMMLRAVGYDAEFGGLELAKYLLVQRSDPSQDPTTTTSTSTPNDVVVQDEEEEELNAALMEFLMSIQEAGQRATSTDASDSNERRNDDERWKTGLSDTKEGGVTRVTSVKYSEDVTDRFLEDATGATRADLGSGATGSSSSSNAPPTQLRMDEQERMMEEDEKRKHLEMAKRAAAVQQSILDGLKGMEEEDRARVLEEAREVHDKFMREALEFPPGPERVAFMQGVSAETQRSLLMHKLWESMH